MKRSKKSMLARPGYLLLILVIVLAAGWAHRAFFSDDGIASRLTEAPRIVVVDDKDAPSTSEALRGTLVAGELPSGVHEAEVLSDRDCAPDADGISHCLTELAIGSQRITIRHHHRMSEVPCLRPGEIIAVMNEDTRAARKVS